MSLAELAALRGPLRLPVERDLYFKADKAISAYAREARMAVRIVTQPSRMGRPLLRWRLAPFFWKARFRLQNQFACAALQRPRDLEDQCQRGHVLATLDLAHVGALDACEVCQRFLGDAVLCANRAHSSAEGERRHGIECRCAGRPSSLDCTLGLHGSKRRETWLLKPR